MKQEKLAATAVKVIALVVVLGALCPAMAQDVKTPYPNMAPLDQYLMDRTSEMALAQSAAPDSISHGAEVLVLGRHGYETATQGKNGFVCLVQRSWTAPSNHPDFWNPKLRAPICLNPAAARFFLPRLIRKTELVLAGRSEAQMFEAIVAAIDKKELPAPESGAMCYMMSKQGYLNDRDGRWHPHLMFFAPQTDPATWGADQAGAPVIASSEAAEHITVFMIPVRKWSDGTADR